jgi:hypothetical protein
MLLTDRLIDDIFKKLGAVVQLGARLTGSQKVTGSNPVGSTILMGCHTNTSIKGILFSQILSNTSYNV